MKKFLIPMALLSFSAFAHAENDSHLPGSYECHGKELDKETSFKLIMTVEKTGETYSLNSHDPQNKNDSYSGTGIYDSASKSLSAAFVNSADPKETGLIIFHARTKNKLAATWTYLGKRSTAQGFCKKMRN